MNVGRWRVGVALATAVLALSCSAGDDSSEAPAPTEDAPRASAARAVDTEAVPDSDPSVFDDPTVDPEAVIIAAVLLNSGGDVDGAVAQGAFTRADLELARAALADGSLDYLFE